MENDRMTAKTMQIRNSTVDFLVFTKQNSQDSIEVRVQDENVWLTQEGISRLFDKGRSTITGHLNAIFAEGELNEDSVCRKFRLTAADGKSYQKITDIYATSADYSKDAKTTKDFFAHVQNKLHFAVSGNTAAEIVYNRADSTQKHIGLTSWKNSPDGKIYKDENAGLR